MTLRAKKRFPKFESCQEPECTRDYFATCDAHQNGAYFPCGKKVCVQHAHPQPDARSNHLCPECWEKAGRPRLAL